MVNDLSQCSCFFTLHGLQNRPTSNYSLLGRTAKKDRHYEHFFDQRTVSFIKTAFKEMSWWIESHITDPYSIHNT